MAHFPVMSSRRGLTVQNCAYTGQIGSSARPIVPTSSKVSDAQSNEQKSARNGDQKEGAEEATSKDPFVQSNLVYSLNESSFAEFVSKKDVALVMFYDPSVPECQWSRKHFKKAAKTTEKRNHAYAAVNCLEEPILCEVHEASHYPFFTLYTKGYVVSSVTETRTFTHQSMRKFVENSPVFKVSKNASKKQQPRKLN